MKKIISDPFEKMETGVYMDCLDMQKKEFPYNMRKLREFLHTTGKTLSMLTPNEMEEFRIPGR